MARVQVVGRRRAEERCAICHGDLGEGAARCSVCGAATHADCGAAHGKCPTLGCTGTLRGAGEPVVRATPARHRAPGSRARVGPYSRLALSALATSLVIFMALAFMAWPALDWHGFWDFATRTKRGRHDTGSGVVTFAVTFGFALFALAFAVNWLRRIPAVFREVRHLLDDTRPVPMTLSTYSRHEGKKTVWYAKLESPEQPTLDLKIDGILPAGWLRHMPPRTRVLVYGLPPPGPYLIELPDGRLALVHPD